MPDEAASISRPDVFSAAETLDERNPREVDAWLWCLSLVKSTRSTLRPTRLIIFVVAC